MSFFGIPIRNGLSLGLGTVASLTNGPGFLPSELYYDGTVQGAWYDPSDLTTLFQDAAGTTPVTAVEQAVGLMLDKSKGLVLGSELVTTYYSGGAYNNWNGMTLAGTTLTTVSAPTNGYTARFNVTAGQTYRVAIPATLVPSGGTWSIKVSWSANGTAYSGQIVSVPISTTWFVFVPPATAVSCEVTITRDVASSPGATDTIGPFTGFSVRLLSGNHAYQTTSASRPTLRARYNLLTRSEEFNDAYWARFSTSITTNAAIAPDGTTTADLLVPVTTGIDRWIYRGGFDSSVKTYSVYAKAGGMSWMNLANSSGAGGGGVWFDLTNGVLGTVSAGFTASITSAGDGWYRCSTTQSGSNGANFIIGVCDSDNTRTATASGSNGILIWGAQLTPTAVFPSNTYQRVGAATDYATGAAFPPYLFFDGTDDSMLTNSVDFATVTSDGQARRNLLLNPTQFDTAVWNKGTGGSISANTVVAPDGTLTADAYTWATSTASFAYLDQTVSGNATVTHTYSIWLKRPVGSGSRNLKLVITDFTLTTGVSADFTVTETWQRFTFSRTSANNTGFVGAGITLASSGSIAAGEVLDAWGAQLETGSTATAFQNIGTDKMLVVAGVTKNSDATAGVLAELTSSISTNNGAFAFFAPDGAAPRYLFSSKGTGQASAQATGYTAPITNVTTGIGDIGADISTLRVNGVQAATSAADQGTGNYSNAALYIGRRNNASLPLNGNLYSLIIAGQSYSSGQISSTESWVAAKTPLGTI